MENFMGYSCGIIGMAQIGEEQAEKAVQIVKEATEEVLQKGYQYFWLALTGEGCLYYTKGIKEAITGRNGVTLEAVSPYPAWIGEQTIPERYKDTLYGIPLEYVCQSHESDVSFAVYSYVLDISSHMIVVSDGRDKKVNTFLQHIQKSEVPVTVVSLEL